MAGFWSELGGFTLDAIEGISSFVGLDNWLRRITKQANFHGMKLDVEKVIKDAKRLYNQGNSVIDILTTLKSNYDTGGYNLSGDAAIKLGAKRKKINEALTKANKINNLVAGNLDKLNMYTDTLNNPSRSMSDRMTGDETDNDIKNKIKLLEKENKDYVSQIERISKEAH